MNSFKSYLANELYPRLSSVVVNKMFYIMWIAYFASIYLAIPFHCFFIAIPGIIFFLGAFITVFIWLLLGMCIDFGWLKPNLDYTVKEFGNIRVLKDNEGNHIKYYLHKNDTDQ